MNIINDSNRQKLIHIIENCVYDFQTEARLEGDYYSEETEKECRDAVLKEVIEIANELGE